jgi:hypothetical protein
MKLQDLKVNWLFPFVGIALVAGTVITATAYFDFERKADAAQAFAATLERLFQDQQLSMALEQLQQGDIAAAAKRLDLMLCGDIVRADLELATADALEQQAVQDTFRRIALIRPRTGPGGTPDPAQEPEDSRAEAERILTLALGAAAHTAQAAQANQAPRAK